MSQKLISLILLSLSIAPAAYAYVASSTNYRLELDSVNFGGGLGTSTNYKVESTLGESGTGIISSASYKLYAGYQQMSNANTITISAPADVNLSPNIPQGTNATADGSASWTVTTNNAAGYSLTIAAATSPALAATGDSFADYTPSSSNPDFAFSIGASQSAFAFTPEGSDVASRFLDNGSACATGSSNTASACWDGLSTSAKTIATASSANTPSGTATTVHFRAAVGSNKVQGSGTYSATVTLTATTL